MNEVLEDRKFSARGCPLSACAKVIKKDAHGFSPYHIIQVAVFGPDGNEISSVSWNVDAHLQNTTRDAQVESKWLVDVIGRNVWEASIAAWTRSRSVVQGKLRDALGLDL